MAPDFGPKLSDSSKRFIMQPLMSVALSELQQKRVCRAAGARGDGRGDLYPSLWLFTAFAVKKEQPTPTHFLQSHIRLSVSGPCVSARRQLEERRGRR